MDSYRDTAFYLAVWYAVLTALGAVLLIALNGRAAPTALLVAANVALLFALVLMARVGTPDGPAHPRGQFWRTLPSKSVPAGEGGVRIARRALKETWLRFAKGAARSRSCSRGSPIASNGVSASRMGERRPASPHRRESRRTS